MVAIARRRCVVVAKRHEQRVVCASIQRRALLRDAGALVLAGDKVGGTAGPPARRGGNHTTLLRRGGKASRATVVRVSIQRRTLTRVVGPLLSKDRGGGRSWHPRLVVVAARGRDHDRWWSRTSVAELASRFCTTPVSLPAQQALPFVVAPLLVVAWGGVLLWHAVAAVVGGHVLHAGVAELASCGRAQRRVCSLACLLAFIIVAACGGVPLVWWLVARVRWCDVAARVWRVSPDHKISKDKILKRVPDPLQYCQSPLCCLV